MQSGKVKPGVFFCVKEAFFEKKGIRQENDNSKNHF